MAKFDSYYREGPTSATFLVEVDGRQLGQFREVSGLTVSVEFQEVVEGGQNFFAHKLPGRFTFPNVTLRRGLTEDNGLIAWIDECTAGGFEKKGKKLKRTTVAIVLLSSNGKRLRTWTLQEAFPVSWKGPDFSIQSDDFLVEEVEIAHHGFTISAGAGSKAKKPSGKSGKPKKKKATQNKSSKAPKPKKKAATPPKKQAAPPPKKPAKASSRPGYMASTASSRAKQKPPVKKK
ncbi:MAG: phage tail protein [Ilumatobacteraceae bacterium]